MLPARLSAAARGRRSRRRPGRRSRRLSLTLLTGTDAGLSARLTARTATGEVEAFDAGNLREVGEQRQPHIPPVGTNYRRYLQRDAFGNDL